MEQHAVGEGRRVHVLVADDEPHIGRIIKMKLEQGPFRVTLAYDGREALDALERTEAQLSAFGVHLPRRGARERT